jgi:N utilization substance protein B
MTLPAQKAREMVLQLLYSHDLAKAEQEAMAALMMGELSVTKKAVKEAQKRVEAVLELLPQIDQLVAKASHSYQFSRIQAVERNVLRLGVYELLFDESIPPKVAIAEAMRLTRKFSTPEAAAFVNAILDHLYRKNLGEAVDDTEVAKTYEDLLQSEELAKEASHEKQS